MAFFSRKWLTAQTIFLICIGAALQTPLCASAQDSASGKDTCASMSEAELHGIFDKLAPGGLKVISRKSSPVNGLCEIALGSMLNPQIVYLDSTKRFVLPGPIFDARTMMNLTLVSRQEIQDRYRVDVARIPLEHSFLLGEATAPRKVIVFTDPDCPFCSTLHQTLQKIVLKRTDVAFQIKLLPLPMHRDAYWKSKSILCNGSLKMLEDAFAKREVPRTDCQLDEPDRTLQLAQSLDLNSTPAMVFPNGSVVVGLVPEDELLKRLDAKP